MMYSEIYAKSEYDCLENDNTLYESINTNPLHSSDLENMIPVKGILKNKYNENKYNNNNINNDVNNINESSLKHYPLLLNHMLRFILIIITLPFLFCDLSYTIENDQCINVYPRNFNLNFRIFLLISSIFETLIVIYNILYYCHNYNYNYKYIFLQILSKIFVILLSIAYFIWNIIGIFIFGSVIYNSNICGNSLYNYLIISIIIKIILNFIIIINYKI